MNRLLVSGLLVVACAAPRADSKAATLHDFLVKRGYTAVPMKANVQNCLTFYARVNGHKAFVMVDTGAPYLIVDTKLAAGLKPVAELPKKMYGLFRGFTTPGYAVALDNIELGSITLRGQRAAVVGLHFQPVMETHTKIAPSQTGYDLVIGWEFLSRHHAIVDFPKATLFLRETEPPQQMADELGRALLAGGYELVPLTARGLEVEVSGTINDRPALFSIDSGAGGTRLDVGQTETLGVELKRRAGMTVDAGGAQRAAAYGAVRAFRVGKFQWENMPVFADDLQLLNAARKESSAPAIQGLLGADFLTRSRSVLDCANLRLYVFPGN